ncbi:hypothetical protein CCL12_27060 [Pseudomonas syringae]|nr:hypothetical protein CCL12_27060 [Pseudomonas syringae]PBP52026.1 hypothetical protein CCL18_24810 [Pseudomonas syringae]PBP65264.1 hypothetical protein CCL19_15790 [Pseudomonas syringae]PBP82559.1 hypothetical protein CCL20_19370 [Pseudomonas syringae]QNR44568.1 hypothetical protein D5S12_26240 [Pseudomonas syringae]
MPGGHGSELARELSEPTVKPSRTVHQAQPGLTIVPMLRVGMPFVTFRVTSLRSTALSRSDAERPELRSHAGAWER